MYFWDTRADKNSWHHGGLLCQHSNNNHQFSSFHQKEEWNVQYLTLFSIFSGSNKEKWGCQFFGGAFIWPVHKQLYSIVPRILLLGRVGLSNAKEQRGNQNSEHLALVALARMECLPAAYFKLTQIWLRSPHISSKVSLRKMLAVGQFVHHYVKKNGFPNGFVPERRAAWNNWSQKLPKCMCGISCSMAGHTWHANYHPSIVKKRKQKVSTFVPNIRTKLASEIGIKVAEQRSCCQILVPCYWHHDQENLRGFFWRNWVAFLFHVSTGSWKGQRRRKK
jgi:hypothetical protein